jgi:glucose-1-phosphate adenylyltransferase
MDLLKPNPAFNLFDKAWPLRALPVQYPPIKIITAPGDKDDKRGFIIDSLVAGGCEIKGAQIERSILSPNIRIEPYAQIHDSILMEDVTVGEHARIKNTIIDKEVDIPAHMEIGFNLDLDRQRFDVTTSGIVIVAKRTHISP